jgi:hypothetical protein
MSKSNQTSNSRAVLLIDAPEADVIQLHNDLPGWLWLGASENWPFDGDLKPTNHPIDAIIVFAHKEKEKRALDICSRIYEKQELKGVSLFIAGSRYQMDLAHEVKRLPRGDFLFTPIDKNELLERMRIKESVTS